MKIIDLFNMSSKGEELPKKISFEGEEYYLDEFGYYKNANGSLFDDIDMDDLNKEITVVQYKDMENINDLKEYVEQEIKDAFGVDKKFILRNVLDKIDELIDNNKEEK